MKRKINKAMPGIDLGNGWVKAKRNWAQARELMAKSRNAMCLLYLIALRAWRGPGINRHGCCVGEGFIGDYEEWGFTQMEYRVAKKNLEQLGFVSFRTTNRGTIAKLLGQEMFDINIESEITDRAEQRADNDQAASRQRPSNEQAASRQRTSNEQAASRQRTSND